jgi:DNA-binding transcriptional LysR family regulator
LLAHAESIIGELAEAERDLAALRTVPGGMVAIGMTPALAASLRPRLVSAFHRRYPDVLIRLVEGFGGHLREQLAKGAVHAVLMYGAPELKDFQTKELFTADDHLVGPKGARPVAGETVPFASLDALPFVLSRPDNATRRRFDRVCRQTGIRPRILVETDSATSMRAVVLDQGIFTMLPYSTAQADVAAGVVDSARIVDPALHSRLSLTTAPWMPLSQAARHLVETVRRKFLAMVRKHGWPTSVSR